MRIVISEFISLDCVVQAPGGANEDTDGGFRHGGWSMQFFDPDVMGSSIGETAERTLILGLPGNPVSAQLTFALFGMPLLRALQGDEKPLPASMQVVLAHPVTQKPGRLGHPGF